tara:strand:+ start:256 stop:405 length:150 start_codon:yes stop_codon:yes gene_type:complete
MVEFLTSNWQIITIVILVVDKIVALSPTTMDDLIWTSVKGFLYKVTGKK